MVPKQRPRASKSWAYAYQLTPAQRDGRLWTGQIVMEAHITHILVVTDDPDEVRAVDRAIGTELKRLKMGFAITGPARVSLPRVTPGGRVAKIPARAVGRSRGT